MAIQVVYYGTQEPFRDYLRFDTIEELNEAYREIRRESENYRQNPANLPNADFILRDIRILADKVKEKRNKLIADREIEYLTDALGAFTPSEEKKVRNMIADILVTEYYGTRLPQPRVIEYKIGRDVAQMMRDNDMSSSSSMIRNRHSSGAEEPPAKKPKEGDGMKLKRMLKYNIHSRRHSKVY